MVRGITRSLVLLGFVAAAGSAYASNLDYATNNSPEFFRNPAGRTSAVDSADIAANNPAGTVRMGEGFFVNISNQTVIKKYTVVDRSTGQDYHSKEPDLIVPNLYAVWNPKGSQFSFWSHVGIIGGGGSLYYPDGAPVVNRVIAAGMAGVDAAVAAKYGYNSAVVTPFSGMTANNFTTAAGMLGAYSAAKNKYHFSVFQQSYQICQTIGSTYAVSDKLSIAAGGRVVESFKRNTIYQSTGADAPKKFIDVDMRAVGVQGIIGINYRPVSVLNIALTYETVNKMRYKVDVKSNGSDAWGTLSKTLTDSLGMEDGKKFDYDMPHRFMGGVTWDVTSDFDLTFAGLLYINDGFGVDIDTGTNDEHDLRYLNSIAYELGMGFDLKLTKKVVWSLGFMWDNTNQKDAYMNEVNYHPQAYVLNTGFMFKVNDDLNISMGFGRNFFPNAKNNRNKAYNAEPGVAEPALTGSLGTLNTALGGSELARSLTFKKETWVTAVGAQYRF